MFPYWDAWNRDHATKHGVSEEEAAYVALHARPPYPQEIGDDKFAVWGSTPAGRFLQVVFTYWPVERVDLRNVPPNRLVELEDEDEVIYIIHARELAPREKRRLRRRRRP